MSNHGNSFHVPYTAMGSGSLAALAVLENRYKDGLSEEEAIELAADAIQAGIFHDLGSGSNVNIISATKGGVKKIRNYRVFNKKEFNNEEIFKFKRGTTEVLSTEDRKWEMKQLYYEDIKMDIDL